MTPAGRSSGGRRQQRHRFDSRTGHGASVVARRHGIGERSRHAATSFSAGRLPDAAGSSSLLVERREQGGGGHELELVYAADAAQRVAQLLQAHRGALHQQHLERLVVLEEDMLGRDNFLQVIDLRLGELLTHPAPISAVDERDRAREHVLGPGQRLMFRKRVADQFGNQLGPGRQPAFLDHHVQLAKQLCGKAHAEPGETGGFGAHPAVLSIIIIAVNRNTTDICLAGACRGRFGQRQVIHRRRAETDVGRADRGGACPTSAPAYRARRPR